MAVCGPKLLLVCASREHYTSPRIRMRISFFDQIKLENLERKPPITAKGGPRIDWALVESRELRKGVAVRTARD